MGINLERKQPPICTQTHAPPPMVVKIGADFKTILRSIKNLEKKVHIKSLKIPQIPRMEIQVLFDKINQEIEGKRDLTQAN